MKDRPGRIATNPANLTNSNYSIGQAIITQTWDFTWTPVASAKLSSVTSSLTSPETTTKTISRPYGYKFDRIQYGVKDGRFNYGDDLLDFYTTARDNSWGSPNQWQSTVSSLIFDIGNVGKAIYGAGYSSGRALVFLTFCGIAYGTGNRSPEAINGKMRLLRSRINSGPGGATVSCDALGDATTSITDDGLGVWFSENPLSQTSAHFCFHALVEAFNIWDAYNLSSQRSWTTEFVPMSTCDGLPNYGLPKYPSLMVSIVAEDYT